MLQEERADHSKLMDEHVEMLKENILLMHLIEVEREHSATKLSHAQMEVTNMQDKLLERESFIQELLRQQGTLCVHMGNLMDEM